MNGLMSTSSGLFYTMMPQPLGSDIKAELPPEIALHIAGNLNVASLREFRLVSKAARDLAEKRLEHSCINFTTLSTAGAGSLVHLCQYYKNLPVPIVRIKVTGLQTAPILFTQFVTSLANNNHLKEIHLDLSENEIGRYNQELSDIHQMQMHVALFHERKDQQLLLSFNTPEQFMLLSDIPEGGSLEHHIQASSQTLSTALNPQHLAEQLSTLSNLTSLDLSRNKLKNGDVTLLMEGNSTQNLKKLDLSRNDLQDGLIIDISTVPKLKSLNLSGNLLTDLGMSLLSKDVQDLSSEEFNT